ncbi:MAG: hypothetical protein ACI8QG_001509, partial [Flavobacteriales bacterium]
TSMFPLVRQDSAKLLKALVFTAYKAVKIR